MKQCKSVWCPSPPPQYQSSHCEDSVQAKRLLRPHRVELPTLKASLGSHPNDPPWFANVPPFETPKGPNDDDMTLWAPQGLRGLGGVAAQQGRGLRALPHGLHSEVPLGTHRGTPGLTSPLPRRRRVGSYKMCWLCGFTCGYELN